MTNYTEAMKRATSVPYALRRVPLINLDQLVPCPAEPFPGDIVLTELLKIGKNTRLELANGRAAALHEGDLIAAVFGHRYATEQFEGYARCDGETCHLLSMGGVCGMVASRHANVPEPSKLRLLGAIADSRGRALRLSDYSVAPVAPSGAMNTTVVCGSSMDAGKTHTAMSLVVGLKRAGLRVASIKLTGTATGRDTWSLLDAGATPALDFGDGGLPSTYMCPIDKLLALYERLLPHASLGGATRLVIEIADGLLQRETESLLRSEEFMSTVSRVVFATSDPLGALGGVTLLRQWGIEPAAISGLISMSPLAMAEATAATGLPCFTAQELQDGALNDSDPRLFIMSRVIDPVAVAVNGQHEPR
jgi:hypothetical protein